MHSGGFSAVQSYLHHPSVAAYPADQSVNIYPIKTTTLNFNKYVKPNESVGISLKGPQVIPSSGIDFLLDEANSLDSK